MRRRHGNRRVRVHGRARIAADFTPPGRSGQLVGVDTDDQSTPPRIRVHARRCGSSSDQGRKGVATLAGRVDGKQESDSAEAPLSADATPPVSTGHCTPADMGASDEPDGRLRLTGRRASGVLPGFLRQLRAERHVG
jgi:hypothetical protein